jgi:penicillin-binding protein 2
MAKTAQIQLLDSSYRDKAQTATINKYVLYPSRGLVYDRNETLLTYNQPIYELMATYRQIDPDMDIAAFCEILDISQQEYKKRINKKWGRRYSKSVPFSFMRRLSAPIYGKLQESLHEFPGFYVQKRNIRGYRDSIASHVLGYISEVNADQIENNDIYAPGDYIGSTGLESYYENELRGKKGIKYQLKDNLGRIVGAYKDGSLNKNAESGKDLKISIDAELQKYGELLMHNKLGSIVAIEPATGEILTMLSAPTYNPDQLSISRERGDLFKNINEDPLKPFFNRAVSAKYPPGSLFKPIVGLIAMQEKTWDFNRYVPCSGAYWNVNRFLGCHDHSAAFNMGKAIQFSCNSYFCETFKSIIDKEGFHNPNKGLDLFNSYLYEFGLGRTLDLDFQPEKSGNIPTTKYYDKLYGGRSWRSPTIVSLGIGQGELQLTTLQMANLASIIANRGYYYTPHLVKDFINSDEEIDLQYRTPRSVRIDSTHFENVIIGMANVTVGGTATWSHIPDIEICGKTGTAQNPHGKDHSIFFAFAPRENPKIAIAVYVENAGDGGAFAAPIASLMIEKYIKKEIRANREYMENYILRSNLLPKS